MERVKIEAALREKTGKETAKKVRFKGNIPAIVYGRGANCAVQLSPASLKILNSIHFSQSAVIDMELADAKKKTRNRNRRNNKFVFFIGNRLGVCGLK